MDIASDSKLPYLLVGGPLHGTTCYLSIGCKATCIFEMNGEIGKYASTESPVSSTGEQNTPTHTTLEWMPHGQ